jgi:zinc protease
MLHHFLKRAPAVLLGALLLSGLASHADAQKIAAKATAFTLDNGLQVVVIPDHRAPVVTQMVWYRVGAADDPPGKSGIAHFLEHLMFKGTAAHPEGEFSAKVEALGGNDNAFTTPDYTAYFQTIAKQHLGLMMEFEADRMANLEITDAALIPERQVILEERGMRIDNSPAARLDEAMNAALFQNEHYGIPTIGWAHEMATLDRSDALALYDRYYTPNNAIVVVAGDVTEDEVRALAAKTYGNVARRADPPPRIRLQEPPPLAPRSVELADSRVTQPSFRRLYLAPSYHTANPGEAEALDVLSDILGGGTTSRLYRQLVVEKGMATSAGAGYDMGPLGDSAISVFASPRGDITLRELAAGVDAVIGDLLAKGVTNEEVARAKARTRAAVIYSEDSARGLAQIVGRGLATGGTLEEIQAIPERTEAVTADQVMAVARKYLDPRRSVSGTLVSAPPEGRS